MFRRIGERYIFRPTEIDLWDRRNDAVEGEAVRVTDIIHEHAYISDLDGVPLGIVMCKSLEDLPDDV